MIIPIRCFTCGKLIADKWEPFMERLAKEKERLDKIKDPVERKKNEEDRRKILDDLKLKRICCRRMIITHIDLIDDISVFTQFG